MLRRVARLLVEVRTKLICEWIASPVEWPVAWLARLCAVQFVDASRGSAWVL